MYWKYLIRVLGCQTFAEIRVDSWTELLEEISELTADRYVIEGIYDTAGHPVTV